MHAARRGESAAEKNMGAREEVGLWQGTGDDGCKAECPTSRRPKIEDEPAPTPYNNDYEPLTLNGKENAGLQITATKGAGPSQRWQPRRVPVADGGEGVGVELGTRKG